jgi:hypothetical protein
MNLLTWNRLLAVNIPVTKSMTMHNIQCVCEDMAPKLKTPMSE